MTHHTKHLTALTALIAATALLALAVGTASANHLRVSNQNIRATWTSLRLISSTTATMLCPVTLEGSLHENTVTKTLGTLIGYITRASVTNSTCTGGHFTIHNETLPWHIQYNGFTGTLPSNITAVKVRLIGLSWEIETGGNICSARTEAEEPAQGEIRLTSGVAENFTFETGVSIRLTNGRGGLFCGIAGFRLGGESQTLAVLGSSTRITVTLI